VDAPRPPARRAPGAARPISEIISDIIRTPGNSIENIHSIDRAL
jgi:hypothetical protein